MSKQIRNPVTGWWELIPEPRWTSAAWTGAYGAMGLAGVSVLVDSPEFLAFGAGGVLTVYWGVLLVLGGALGAFAAPTGWYIVERPALLCVGVAMTMYAVATGLLALASGSNLTFQVLLDTAVVLVLLGRWHQVKWGVRDPERYPTTVPQIN